MKKYAIVTDSGCDLSEELINKLDLKVVPMGLLIDGHDYKHYPDCRELSLQDFYKKIASGHIGKTSCVNVSDAMETMKIEIEKGLDILYLSFSAGMSGSYQSAVIATNELRELYPDTNIEVIDTLSGSVGLGMLAYLAAKKRDLGESLISVSSYIKDSCLKICHYFMVEDINFLKETGRISTLTSIVASVMNIRPVFKLANDGKIVLEGKIRGRKTAIKHLLTKVKEKCISDDVFFICHADAEKDANILAEQIKEEYPNAEINISWVGPVVGNNTGPGTLAVIFFGDER